MLQSQYSKFPIPTIKYYWKGRRPRTAMSERINSTKSNDSLDGANNWRNLQVGVINSQRKSYRDWPNGIMLASFRDHMFHYIQHNPSYNYLWYNGSDSDKKAVPSQRWPRRDAVDVHAYGCHGKFRDSSTVHAHGYSPKLCSHRPYECAFKKVRSFPRYWDRGYTKKFQAVPGYQPTRPHSLSPPPQKKIL